MLATGLRVVAFNVEAAEVAARMRADALVRRAGDASRDARGAVLYDTLIAATAVQLGAAAILTANKRDFEGQLAAVRSSIRIVYTREPPAGQAALPGLETVAKGKKKPATKRPRG